MKIISVICILLFYFEFAFASGAASPENAGVPYDPTRNVLQLVEAAVKRLDDIQSIQKKSIEDMLFLQSKMLEDKLTTFMNTSKELAAAEKSRVDAIRAVDVNAAVVDRERATTQAQVLATQVQASAENLRLLVATTAEATAKQNLAVVSDLAKRITDLEKVQNATIGASGGVKDLWGWILAVIMTLIAVSTFIIPKLKTELYPEKRKGS